MEAFEAYQLYLSLKRHFTPGSNYDYFKYNGKTNATKSSFDTRHDKYSFHKLSKRADPKYFLISNFIDHGYNIWIGDLVTDSRYDDSYKKWLKRKESISYTFKEEFNQIAHSLDDHLKVKDGQYPKLLELYIRKKISIETIIILNNILNFLPKWNKNIVDVALWPDIYNTCVQYTPFIEYDPKKIKNILFETLET